MKLKDYYTKRVLNPDGKNLALFQYENEYKTIDIDGVRYEVVARYIGEGFYDPPVIFFIHIESKDTYYVNGYFNEDDLVDDVNEVLLSELHKRKQVS